MTVQDAKTKVCPFMSGCLSNEHHAGFYEVKCVASNCMAWIHTDIKTLNGKSVNNEATNTGYCLRIGQ